MPIELAPPLSAEIELVQPQNLARLGRLLAIVLVSVLLVGFHFANFSTPPGEAEQSIAGP